MQTQLYEKVTRRCTSGVCLFERNAPLCCMTKRLASLIWERFPNTRVASKTPSILEPNKSFSSTAMTGARTKRLAKNYKCSRFSHASACLTLGDVFVLGTDHRALSLVERQVVDGGGGIYQKLFTLLHTSGLWDVEKRKQEWEVWNISYSQSVPSVDAHSLISPTHVLFNVMLSYKVA